MTKAKKMTFYRPNNRKPTPKQQAEMDNLWAEVKKAVQADAKPIEPWSMVKDFHEVMGQPVGEKPHMLAENRQKFRLGLIDEEYNELVESLEQGDLVNSFKEMADLVYVIAGLAVEMGGNLDAVFAEVHRSNMTKVGPDGKVIYNEHGKVLKPDTYEPADVQGVLF